MRNFILSTFNALFLSFIAVGAQNATTPTPGTYLIINRIPTESNHEYLAVTLRGGRHGGGLTNVVVDPVSFKSPPAIQRWIISDPDTTGAQFIIPFANQSEAAGVEDFVVVANPKNSTFAWTIKRVSGGYYTIESPTADFWGIDIPEGGTRLFLWEFSDRPSQKWVLYPVK